jgi:hypothetical protein
MWNSLDVLFGGGRVTLFGYARAALLAGLEVLGLGPGDTVLVPSYICDSVLAPFNDSQVKFAFYSVGQDLKADLSSIGQALTTGARALLAVNYFGFSQDYKLLVDFCRRNGLLLIEDNAHGFLSRDAGGLLGRYGDIAICSFRKVLPIPNGAALIVNNTSLPAADTRRLRRSALGEFAGPLRMLLRQLDQRIGAGVVDLYRKRRYGTNTDGEVQAHAEEHEIGPYLGACLRYSRLATRLVDAGRLGKVRRARYARWQDWAIGQAGIEPIFRLLPDGVVPMVFPFLARNPTEAMHRISEELGVEVNRWPNLPAQVRKAPGDYPEFYRQVLTIPLKQSAAVRPLLRLA